MIRFEFLNLDPNTVLQLLALSEKWVEENCSWGMRPNETEDLWEPVAAALEGDRIVGYAFGHCYEKEISSTCIEAGTRCFSLDELYVLPEYRGRGIGSTLYQMLQERFRGQCAYLTLTTSTKNYKAILKLYVEELGMDFHSAYLIKKLNRNPGEETR